MRRFLYHHHHLQVYLYIELMILLIHIPVFFYLAKSFGAVNTYKL